MKRGEARLKYRAVRGINYPDPAKAGLYDARGQRLEVRREPGDEIPEGDLSARQIGDYLACGAIEILGGDPVAEADLVAEAAEGE